ncbi:uncharacterized protein LOC141631958 [Silene latifolia]|uniref:uncharacterized protein LOC141631958 n=1 Tax=Silene latifolia TaxID=37657 RepID=UPI003D775EEC
MPQKDGTFSIIPFAKIYNDTLMFADDLPMFRKGTARSIMLLVRAFSTFSKASGLIMNNGGLGVKNAAIWNTATVAKLVDWLYCKADRLWIKWELMKPRLCADGQWMPMLWGYTNNGINTREKLFRIGYSNSDKCCVCEAAPETQEHLFFECGYIKLIMNQIRDWRKLQLSVTGDIQTAESTTQQGVYALVLTASYYHVWTQRNNARSNAVLVSPKRVVQMIKDSVRHGIKVKRNDHMSSVDMNWLCTLEN